MSDDRATLNTAIEALTDQLAECDDASQRRELREQIKALRQQLTSLKIDGEVGAHRDVNIANQQEIRNVTAQDYTQGDLDKRTFYFINFYQHAPQLQEPAWQKVDWDAAEQRYKAELVKQYGTMHGMCQ